MTSCIRNEVNFYNGFGRKPIYVSPSELDDIGNESRHPSISSGPIFLKDDRLFITESLRGIHVHDISDSTNAEYVTFLKIPAITDFTISGDRLYADSWVDLVTIDITDIYNIKLVGREEGIIDPYLFPPAPYQGWFECVDLSKGAVIDWEETQLIDAKCRTF